MGSYIFDIAKILKSPSDAGATVVGYDSNNTAGAVISSLAIAETLLSEAYTSPYPGAFILAASLGNNLAEADSDYYKTGKIDDSTLMALTVDLLNLIALGVAKNNPRIATLALLEATGLALVSTRQGNSTDIWDFYADTLNKVSKLIKDLKLEPYINDLFKETSDWWKHELGHISDNVNSLWEQARNWIARRDPLVLDLDGDGIETVGVNATTHVLFDHNNDGVKTGTGWVKGDDGLLVLDRNGNGVIDNGSELFGDATMVNGVKATDGFSALRFRHPEFSSGSKRVVNTLDFTIHTKVA